MCGITGAIWFDPAAGIAAETLKRMTDVLRHRGPDDEGSYRSEWKLQSGYGATPGVALGHRRLSIIDLALGHQPLSNEDGSVWIVFNGEIYNHRELRQRLEGSGHQFRTHSDTETIVHLYEDEGLDFLRHLNGMFALAIWDANARRLVLARDRLGKKPLYYRLEPNRLLFASELKSLLQVRGIRREIDHQALDEYLTYQYVPHPRTIFRGFSKLPPAHYGVYEEGRWKTACYWQPDFDQEINRPIADYAAELRELLTSAVRLRLEADVPLGAFLSGGVDSSLIVGLMQSQVARPVKTFSIGFPIPEYDETANAREVAQRLGTEHHEFHLEPQCVDVLEKLVWHYDEPFADSSAIPTYYVSKLTREHVTVALTGDGGDELFAGYLRYRAVRLASCFDSLPRVTRSLLSSPLWQRLGRRARSRSLLRRTGRFAEALGLDPRRRYLRWLALFDESARADLYSEQFLGELPDSDPFDFLAQAFARCPHRDQVTSASLTDLVTYLPGDLMTKVDIASMANSLECRAPFLDYRVVELAARMPVACKLYASGRGKRVLREAFGDLLPSRVMRRPKMGFGVPLEHWFRNELKDYSRQVLLDSRAAARGYFRPGAVEQMLDEHQTGRFDHGYRLWGLLFFELWHRQWMDNQPTPLAVSASATT
ncbi:MAG: asparagine synthase (glutamine-hydrolyzing) [Planctomycetia bacterium]|nr:asparagine synthase (glutamine-hydrolyzing) [Planctomycetia bacterium]